MNNVYDLKNDLQKSANDEALIEERLQLDASKFSDDVPEALKANLSAKLAATQVSESVNSEMRISEKSSSGAFQNKKYLVPFALAASIALMFVLYPSVNSPEGALNQSLAEQELQKNKSADSELESTQKQEPIATLALQNEMSALKSDIGKLRNQIASL